MNNSNNNRNNRNNCTRRGAGYLRNLTKVVPDTSLNALPGAKWTLELSRRVRDTESECGNFHPGDYMFFIKAFRFYEDAETGRITRTEKHRCGKLFQWSSLQECINSFHSMSEYNGCDYKARYQTVDADNNQRLSLQRDNLERVRAQRVAMLKGSE